MIVEWLTCQGKRLFTLPRKPLSKASLTSEPKEKKREMLSLGRVSFPPKPIYLIPESSFPAIQIRHKCPISVLAPSIKMTRSSVVMRAKREEELKEIRAKITEKLTKRLLILKVNSWCSALRDLHAMSLSPVSFAVCAKGYLSFSLSIVFCLLFLAC